MAQKLILIITCKVSILLSQVVHAHPYRTIEIILHDEDFFLHGDIYLYTFTKVFESSY